MKRTDWHDARVLVTGARGFIASHVCRRLSAERAHVFGVSRTPPAERGSVRWLRGNVANADDIRGMVERTRPDVVFHLAGHVVGSQRLEDVEPTFRLNLASTVHLLTAAVAAGRPRVVLAGSMQEPHAGDPEAVPCSPYAASKWACSAYSRLFHALYELPVVTARIFMVYGPGQWDSSKLLPYVILSLLRGESPRVASGLRELDWVYVDDVVDALMAIAASDYADARSIDVGTGQLTSVRQIIDRLVAILGSDVVPQYGAIPDRPLERTHAADPAEAMRLVGWKPAVALDDGLRRTVAWYHEQLTAGVR